MKTKIATTIKNQSKRRLTPRTVLVLGFTLSVNSLFLLLGTPITAQAGPLRDRIMERMEERREQRENNNLNTNSADNSVSGANGFRNRLGANSGEDGDRRLAQGMGRSQKSNLELPDNVQFYQNVSYGANPNYTMDIYAPKNASGAPVILMVHGGGWSKGDKAMSRVVDNKVKYFTQKGYVFISINNRLMPEANPLEQAGDVARALAFAQSQAASFGGSPNKFILMGHSAGAHLVSLLTSKPGLAEQFNARPWLGTVSLDGAGLNIVDIMSNKHFKLYDNAFGTDKNLWVAASPTLQLNSKTPPILLVCSSKRKDSADSCGQSQAYQQKARQYNSYVDVLPEYLSHGEINENLGLEGEYTQAVQKFIDKII